MSDTTVDLLLKDADTQYHQARGRLTGLIESRIAQRVRAHFPSATDLVYQAEHRDDGAGWSIVVMAVNDDDKVDLIIDAESLDEAIGEEPAQEIEQDLEWLCDLDGDYTETATLYLDPQVDR